MPVSSISIEHAKEDKLFYFVANVVVFRDQDGRCLLLKRSDQEKVHPGLWAIPGGKLEWNNLDIAHPIRIDGEVLNYDNAILELIEREVAEEAGIRLKSSLAFIGSMVFIRPDGIPVVLIKFAARYKSGQVRPEPGVFTNHAWVNEKEVKNYSCIGGVAEDVIKTIKVFTSGGS